MSTEPQLFRVNPGTKESRKVSESDFTDLGFLERDIQDWVVANPGILGGDLLIVAKEFSDFDRTKERLDLLAVDPHGTLVIIELKRDHSGADAHWQAIKYASYLRQATQQEIIGMLADHESVTPTEAENQLAEHIGSESLENLNHDQRVILVSHRFATEVTSAALWINEKAQGDDLITCVQLMPYQIGEALHVLANTIIPVPGTESYSIQIENSGTGELSGPGLRQRPGYQNRDDNVTRFVQNVEATALEKLPNDLKPDRRSRFARLSRQTRYYSMWYSDRHPWARSQFSYVIHVVPGSNGSFRVAVNFEARKRYLRSSLGWIEEQIDEFNVFLANFNNYDTPDDERFLRSRQVVAEDTAELDDALVERTAASLANMIKTITPEAEEFVQNLGVNPDE